ncbi:hypothetical protein PBCVNW6652_893L [Paramecium bursaria Chlorella virus NW665.2]|nr:hypothetical protein PBCVNW6652_893L [Paramecium bursaria Chlorella virus NW665.2]
MGNVGSTGGTGRAVRVADISKSKCSRIPPYADRRVWVLKELYKVKNINEFPPQKYSAQDAEEDIRACIGGFRLPGSWKVVSTTKLEQEKGSDLRRYALRKYHGYGYDIDERTLSLLPYSKQNAARDVQYYKKYRMPYFIVDKLQSTVRSRDGKISRAPGQKGTSLDYKYNRAQMDKKGKFEAKKKYDVKKYPLQSMKDGSVGRVIPCSVDPSQCTPGQTTFISRDVGNILKRAAVVDAKSRKQQLKMLQTTHSKKIAALNRKIASAPPEVKARLQKQRQNMQLKFRLNTAKAEQTNRIKIQNSRSSEWKKKRAELGRQKQQQKQQEKMRQKQIEAERRAAAERKARENAALRAARKQRKMSGLKTPPLQQQAKQRSGKKGYKTPYSRPIGPVKPRSPSPVPTAPPMPPGGFRSGKRGYKTPYSKPIGPYNTRPMYPRPIGPKQRPRSPPKQKSLSWGNRGLYEPIRKYKNPGDIGPFG